MNAREVASFLLRECPSLSHCNSYMFGSYLSGIGVDIDILTVGTPADRLSALKKELRAAAHELPLEILHMSELEEFETKFIANQGCIPLDKLANQPEQDYGVSLL
jgi:hypothetical protein